MKLYTKTGDKGQTGLVGGRTDKDSLRVESYGTIDELNSFIGLALAELSGQPGFEDLTAELLTIQHELFDCGGDLAIVTERKDYKLTEESVSFLETRIDAYTAEAPELKKFILPGMDQEVLRFPYRPHHYKAGRTKSGGADEIGGDS